MQLGVPTWLQVLLVIAFLCQLDAAFGWHRRCTGSIHRSFAVYTVFIVKLILLPYHHQLIVLAVFIESAVASPFSPMAKGGRS